MMFQTFIPSLIFVFTTGLVFVLLQFAFNVHGIVLKIAVSLAVGAVAAWSAYVGFKK